MSAPIRNGLRRLTTLGLASRVFVYGVVLFSGSAVVVNIAGPRDAYGGEQIAWLGAVGGVSFVVSWGALFLLRRIVVELVRAPEQ